MDDDSNNTPINIITTNLSSDSLLSLHSLPPSPTPASLASTPSHARKRALPPAIKHYPTYLDSSYLDYLNNTAAIDFKGLNVKTKCPDDKFVVPDISDYHMLLSYKYKKDQLKTIAKKYKLCIWHKQRAVVKSIYSFKVIK